MSKKSPRTPKIAEEIIENYLGVGMGMSCFRSGAGGVDQEGDIIPIMTEVQSELL